MEKIRKAVHAFFRWTIAALVVATIGMSILHPNDWRTIQYWVVLAATVAIYLIIINDKSEVE